MSFRLTARARLLGLVLSPRIQNLKRSLHEGLRKLAGRDHLVEVFLQLDDPYSYILSCYLPALSARYDIKLQVHLSQARTDSGFQPAADLLVEYSIVDCGRLAEELAIPFLDKAALPPTEYRAALTDALADVADQPDYHEAVYAALAAYWRGDAVAAAAICQRSNGGESGLAMTRAAQQRLRALGHYNSAMLHFAGEWYWGVDRLSQLLARLDALQLTNANAMHPELAALMQVRDVALPAKPPGTGKALPPIELFFSFRSPYSYLALRRCCDIVDAFGAELVLRPVLPMVARGLAVPKAKLRYIAFDAAREAQRIGIPFGKVADPLGNGVNRCMAVFPYAQSENKGREFAVEACTAIWSEAVDVAADNGMRKVAKRCGLFWPEVVSAMQDDDWRIAVEDNREMLAKAGLWGVPAIKIGAFVTWGQDRDWLIIRHLEEMCASEGEILI